MSVYDVMTIGKKIEMLISYRGTTQRALAELIGRSQGLISNWQKGLNVPRAPELAVVADALKVPVDYLVREADERLPNEVDIEMKVREAAAQLGWGEVYSRILGGAQVPTTAVPSRVVTTIIRREPTAPSAVKRKGTG